MTPLRYQNTSYLVVISGKERGDFNPDIMFHNLYLLLLPCGVVVAVSSPPLSLP